ncbi:hypothetical protein PO124_03205 [Bacillus licheniformis]|nr:hypothetical protein [Bacillus licheniformis]
MKVDASNLGAEDKQFADMLNDATLTISGKQMLKRNSLRPLLKRS